MVVNAETKVVPPASLAAFVLVARFLDGLAGSAFLSVAGGTVGDMFARHVSVSCLYAPPC